jgi:hypothetical protein
VARLSASRRGALLLEDRGTRPNVTYLAKLDS